MKNDYTALIYQYAVMGVPKEEIPGVVWSDNWENYYDRIYHESHKDKKKQ